VLAIDGGVLLTCIPHLWLLRDRDGDGEADERVKLQSGFGVRVAFRGHDMHGLVRGPDGRIYFSIGDRGYHVTTRDGKVFANPESGAVFRCEVDGSNLEVFATGLRNPQELAFNQYGDLFTGDNNSDSGDKARWVYVVPGGDSGWRMSYQYLPDRGPFNREKIWHPFHREQPAYIVPPIANLGDGPSGLAYYPGTGFAENFQDFFFLCDFRGTAGDSGVRAIQLRNDGAFFKIDVLRQPVWKILPTDLAFGPDGWLYVSDWVEGWVGEGKGRIYRFADPQVAASNEVAEVRRLLAGDLPKANDEALLSLLGHADQRVRLAAQFELVRRKAIETLQKGLANRRERLVRIHAIWGIGQLAREQSDDAAAAWCAGLYDFANDEDEEIRTQVARAPRQRSAKPLAIRWSNR
jgi:quinoprotein glucose dehydrogenase